MSEAGVFEHRQALIVIQGEYDVEGLQAARNEHCIGRQRSGDIEAIASRTLDGRADDAQRARRRDHAARDGRP